MAISGSQTHPTSNRSTGITPAGVITEYQTGRLDAACGDRSPAPTATSGSAGYRHPDSHHDERLGNGIPMPEISAVLGRPGRQRLGRHVSCHGRRPRSARSGSPTTRKQPDRSCWRSPLDAPRLRRPTRSTLCLVNGRFRVTGRLESRRRLDRPRARRQPHRQLRLLLVLRRRQRRDGRQGPRRLLGQPAPLGLRGRADQRRGHDDRDRHATPALSKTYTNPQGTPFAPIQDTAAFATCQ